MCNRNLQYQLWYLERLQLLVFYSATDQALVLKCFIVTIKHFETSTWFVAKSKNYNISTIATGTKYFNTLVMPVIVMNIEHAPIWVILISLLSLNDRCNCLQNRSDSGALSVMHNIIVRNLKRKNKFWRHGHLVKFYPFYPFSIKYFLSLELFVF